MQYMYVCIYIRVYDGDQNRYILQQPILFVLVAAVAAADNGKMVAVELLR